MYREHSISSRNKRCAQGLPLKRRTGKNVGTPHALDGAQEAHLLALSCSPAPEGHARWTLRLLASRMVQLEYSEQVSYETVRRTLKKTNSNRG